MVAREPTASRATAELNFIVDVWNIKSNDHLDVLGAGIVPPTPRNGSDAFAFEVPSAKCGGRREAEKMSGAGRR